MHTKQCLARALICAVENYRDNELETDEGFLSDAKGSVFLDSALDYYDGLLDCICPPVASEPKPTPEYVEWSARVRDVNKLSKAALIQRIQSEERVLNSADELRRWSKDELVSALCPMPTNIWR